jgi:adenylate cyclase class 1
MKAAWLAPWKGCRPASKGAEPSSAVFHVNHPLLPGYVSGSTPAGLSNFEPDANALAEAQRLTRSFSYKPRHGSNPPRPIHGLFLMGSLGTLAQADQSDMDVWVCHSRI